VPEEPGSGTQSGNDQGSSDGNGGTGGGSSDSGTQQQQQSSGSGSGSGTSSGRTFDEPYVKGLRDEAAGYRTQLADVKKQLDEAQSKDLSEKERLEHERDELKEQLATKEQEEQKARQDLIDERVHSAFVVEAAKFDKPLHDIEDAFTFVQKDYLGKMVKVVDEGGELKIEGIGEALKDLVEKRPYLVKAPETASGRKMAGRTGGVTDDQQREALARKFPAMNPR